MKITHMDIKPTYTWDLLLNLKHVISCLSTIQRVVRLPSTVTVSRSQEINKQVVSSMKAMKVPEVNNMGRGKALRILFWRRTTVTYLWTCIFFIKGVGRPPKQRFIMAPSFFIYIQYDLGTKKKGNNSLFPWTQPDSTALTVHVNVIMSWWNVHNMRRGCYNALQWLPIILLCLVMYDIVSSHVSVSNHTYCTLHMPVPVHNPLGPNQAYISRTMSSHHNTFSAP